MGKLTFGATGLSYQVDRPDLNVGGAPVCPRCATRVYFNEERKLLSKSWHTKCFNCSSCRKSLDSTNANGHDSEIYCTPCHRRLFGIKGYGFAGGAAGLSTETSSKDIYRRASASRLSRTATQTPATQPATATQQPQPQPTHQPQSQPQPSYNGATNNGSTTHNHYNNHIAATPAWTTNTAARVNGSSAATGLRSNEISRSNMASGQVNQKVFRAPVLDRDSPDCCPRCGRRVYCAEEVKAMKRKWHRQCFKCASCQKTLDTGKCEGHKGEVYCTSCYSKSFGPKAHGYASSMIGAAPNQHFHVRSAVSRGANDHRLSGSTTSTPMSPLSPKSTGSVESSLSSHSSTTDHSNEYQPYSQSREEYLAMHPDDTLGDTFNYNGQEWTEDLILKELDQFEQVMSVRH